MARWRYMVKSRGIAIRTHADVAARQSGSAVLKDTEVVVDQAVPGAGGQLYLHLADDRGWIFTLSAQGTVICEYVGEIPDHHIEVICAESGRYLGELPGMPPDLAPKLSLTLPPEPPPPPPQPSSNDERHEEPPLDLPPKSPAEHRDSVQELEVLASIAEPRPSGFICAAPPAIVADASASSSMSPAAVPIGNLRTGTKRRSFQNAAAEASLQQGEYWETLAKSEAAVVEQLHASRELVCADLLQVQRQFEHEEERRALRHQHLCQEQAKFRSASQDLQMLQGQVQQCFEEVNMAPALMSELEQAKALYEEERHICFQREEMLAMLKNAEQVERASRWTNTGRQADENRAIEAEIEQLRSEQAASTTQHEMTMRRAAEELTCLRRRLQHRASELWHKADESERQIAEHRTLEMDEVDRLRAGILEEVESIQAARAEEARARAGWFSFLPEPCLP